MNKPRCFAAEMPARHKPPLQDTRQFGELIYLFQRDSNGSRPHIFDTDAMSNEIEKRLTEMKYDPDRDYIVIGGGLIINCSLCAVVAALYEEFRVLMYDNQKSCYVEGTLG